MTTCRTATSTSSTCSTDCRTRWLSSSRLCCPSDAETDLLHGPVARRFIAAPDGDIGWSAPDEELHRFHNEQTREISAHLCGRRLYQVMLSWGTTDEAHFGPVELEFARIWKAIPKVVFSTTLTGVAGNARLASDGLAAEVAKLKDQPGEGVVSVGGA